MNMQIAICVPFMQGDIWVERLEHLGIEEGLKVYEYTRPKDLAALHGGLENFDAVWVIMDGAKGMEAVYLVREKHSHVPIVWVSDDAQFGLVGYSLRVSAFLRKSCTDEQLRGAIARCRRGKQYDCVNL